MLKLDEKFLQESSLVYGDGDLIFKEGDEGREMFIVQAGEVIVTKQTRRGEMELATLRKGDFVGEMSLLESLPRSATAKARGETRLLAIHPGGFLLKIRRDPTFAFEMLQNLSKRIRVTNDKLTDLLNQDHVSADAIRTIINGTEYTEESKERETQKSETSVKEALA
jgi:CRP/FNR family cyclic AMP-dependent transcriptional regulator